MASFRDQLIPFVSQGLERFANSTLDRVTNNIPFGDIGRVSARPSQKHSTENLEFPFNVASADRGLGNHGHYIMFYINAQEKAKLDTSGRTDRGSVADDPSQQYNIPKFINEWDSVTQSYKTQESANEETKRINDNAKTDPKAIREGRVSTDKTEYKGKGSSIRIKRAPTKRLKTGIAMYMPGTVQVSYKTDYQDTPMGAVTEQALGAYNAAVGANYRDFATNITNMDQGAIELLQQAGLGIVGSIPGMAGVKEAAGSGTSA